jgi:hypothetical protein
LPGSTLINVAKRTKDKKHTRTPNVKVCDVGGLYVKMQEFNVESALINLNGYNDGFYVHFINDEHDLTLHSDKFIVAK